MGRHKLKNAVKMGLCQMSSNVQCDLFFYFFHLKKLGTFEYALTYTTVINKTSQMLMNTDQFTINNTVV